MFNNGLGQNNVALGLPKIMFKPDGGDVAGGTSRANEASTGSQLRTSPSSKVFSMTTARGEDVLMFRVRAEHQDKELTIANVWTPTDNFTGPSASSRVITLGLTDEYAKRKGLINAWIVSELDIQEAYEAPSKMTEKFSENELQERISNVTAEYPMLEFEGITKKTEGLLRDIIVVAPGTRVITKENPEGIAVGDGQVLLGKPAQDLDNVWATGVKGALKGHQGIDAEEVKNAMRAIGHNI
jgi:hypothetical protein